MRAAQRSLMLLAGVLLTLASTQAATFNSCTRIPATQAEGVLQIRAIRIIDGDTLDVGLISQSSTEPPYRVRLAEIDAPEKDQPFGTASAIALRTLVDGKSITLRYRECDRYRRIVGRLYVAHQYIAAAMIRSGAAWFNSQYSDNAELYDIENEARDAKRGLWNLPQHQIIEPWVWRKLSADQRRDLRH